MGETIIMIIWLGANRQVLYEPKPQYKKDLIEQYKEQDKQEEKSHNLIK